MAAIRIVLHPLVSRMTWRRWAYLVLGGVVLAPFVFVAAYPLAAATSLPGIGGAALLVTVLLLLMGAVAAMSALPVVRRLEVVSAKELLGGPIVGQVVPEVVSGRDRVRSGAFFCLHLLFGGVVGALTLTLVPLGASWVVMPLTGWDPQGTGVLLGSRPVLAIVLGLAALVGFVYLCAGLGALLARWAAGMLGRSSAQRLHEVEQIAADLSERNRIARDLHDSVGHALSIVTVQTGAARRLLERDPEFAHEALGSVEDSARQALDELDRALGTLRDGVGARTLAQLEVLVRQTEAAGVHVSSTVNGPVASLPQQVSREAFAIVQECLSNALRHAPDEQVDVVVTVHDDEVLLEVSNPMPPGAVSTRRPTGGRGVPGMRERARALGGDAEAGPVGGRWQVSVRLPVEDM